MDGDEIPGKSGRTVSRVPLGDAASSIGFGGNNPTIPTSRVYMTSLIPCPSKRIEAAEFELLRRVEIIKMAGDDAKWGRQVAQKVGGLTVPF